MVAMPTSTYEGRADKVSYRVQRNEPATAICQQVPDVWDRAQTREMMDFVVADHEYPPKVNATLPTPYVNERSHHRQFTPSDATTASRRDESAV